MVLGRHIAKPVKAFLNAEKAEDVVKFSCYLKQRRKGSYLLYFSSVNLFILKYAKGKKKKKSQQGTKMIYAQEEVNGHVLKEPQEAVHTLFQPRRSHVPFALCPQRTQSTQTVVAIATPFCSRVKFPSALKDYL